MLFSQQNLANCWRLPNGQLLTNSESSTAPVYNAQQVQCNTQREQWQQVEGPQLSKQQQVEERQLSKQQQVKERQLSKQQQVEERQLSKQQQVEERQLSKQQQVEERQLLSQHLDQYQWTQLHKKQQGQWTQLHKEQQDQWTQLRKKQQDQWTQLRKKQQDQWTQLHKIHQDQWTQLRNQQLPSTSKTEKSIESLTQNPSLNSYQVKEFEEKIKSLKGILQNKPEYLYSTDSMSDKIATVWTDLTSKLLNEQDVRSKYDDFYYASINYQNMALRTLAKAELAFTNGNFESSDSLLAEANRYIKLYNLSNSGAIDAYNGNLESVNEVARSIYEGSKASVKFGTAILAGPSGSQAVDSVFMLTDYIVNSGELGIPEAKKKLISEAITDVIFDQVSLKSLNGKTLSQSLSSQTTKLIGSSGIYPILDDIMKNPEFEKAVMTVLAKSGDYYLSKPIKEVTGKALAEALENTH